MLRCRSPTRDYSLFIDSSVNCFSCLTKPFIKKVVKKVPIIILIQIASSVQQSKAHRY